MLRSMFSGLSGLRNHQTALDVIGNNIANVNTVGYKGSRIQFTELLSQTIRGAASPVEEGRGGTNPIQVGLGTGTTAIDVSHQQGNLQSTGNMSDLAIQGNGFFVLSDGGQSSYTRAGSFSFDANGSLVHSNGLKVMGWLADSTGVIDRNSNIAPIVIPVGQTISANPTTTIEYAHNLDSRSDMTGTPNLAEGNSANVERVAGKYLGTVSPAITDVVGSHLISIYSEKHVGDNNGLNGTQTLDQKNVTDVSTFRVVVDGNENTVNLSNGTNSTINEVVSAINAQVIGVTAILKDNAIEIERTKAGESYEVYVYDTGFGTDGIAANLFNGGDGKWAAHAKTVGAQESLSSTDALTGLNNTNDFVVTVNGVDYTFEPDTNGITAASTISDLITAFNTWSQTTALGSGTNAVFMGLNFDGQLYVADNSHDTDGYITVADAGGGADGIADLFFSDVTNWSTDETTEGKTSTAAYIAHTYTEADGGGTYNIDLSFANGDASLDGIQGVSIVAGSDGFKTGSMVIQTVESEEHIVSTSVYDSLGNEHVISLSLTRTDDNTWSWTASGVDTTGSGSLTFDSNGNIRSGATSGSIAVGAFGGASSLTISPDFSSITQYADPSTMVHIGQDGYSNGALQTYSIDTTGEILGIYTNGLNQSIGRIAIGAFNNPGGLLKISDSMFIVSNNSGEVQVGEANTGGRGSISAGTLEMSNVDVAQEFANMIIYQRGFQANSKIISTGDELLQTLVNMKR